MLFRSVAARMGGEEFIVFLPDTPIEGARRLAEQIRTTVAAGRIISPINGDVGRITISLGVTDYSPDETVDDYVSRADQALYASKSAGRDRVTVAPSSNAQIAQDFPAVPARSGTDGKFAKTDDEEPMGH